MSDYYGDATLEDWLEEEVYSGVTPSPEVVAVWEPIRSIVEADINAWMESDDGYGNSLSWRGWGRGFGNIPDDQYEELYAKAQVVYQASLERAIHKARENDEIAFTLDSMSTSPFAAAEQRISNSDGESNQPLIAVSTPKNKDGNDPIKDMFMEKDTYQFQLDSPTDFHTSTDQIAGRVSSAREVNINEHFAHIKQMREKEAQFAPQDGELFYLKFGGEICVCRWDEEERMWIDVQAKDPEEGMEASEDMEDILGRVPMGNPVEKYFNPVLKIDVLSSGEIPQSLRNAATPEETTVVARNNLTRGTDAWYAHKATEYVELYKLLNGVIPPVLEYARNKLNLTEVEAEKLLEAVYVEFNKTGGNNGAS